MTARRAIATMFGLAGLGVAGLAVPGLALAASMPAAGCKSDPATVERNKALAASFFRPGVTTEERIALLDPAYEQHNPIYVKRAKDDKVGTIEAFRRVQTDNARARAAAPPPAPGSQPPPGDPLLIVMAECDFVTVIHKSWRQDPTAPPGTWYDAYLFDTWQVKDGKLSVHWDGFLVSPPADPAAR